MNGWFNWPRKNAGIAKEKMTVDVKRDGEGFLAKVRGEENLYAFAFSKADALRELGNVVEMVESQYEIRSTQ